MKLLNNIKEYLKRHKNRLFLGVVFGLAAFGIVCAMIGHYGTVGFNWKWFLFLDCPLYAFVIWVVWKLIPIIDKIIEFEEKEDEKVKKD